MSTEVNFSDNFSLWYLKSAWLIGRILQEMATTAPKLQVLRSLIKELRNSLQGHERVRHSPAFTYIMDNYRRNAVTDQQYCREQEEMAHLAHTCATYLKSNRKYQELHAEYHGRGERTVKETADLVGFKLPHDPR
ncbi:protein FMC1 homolog isoform X3 [Penaeus monodon]|uniref:protein FMC1 homolog isoform X3 n=1 Tax=Penaeus monodon TaxID=6687 RepID=UPI0018A750C8|nr:protein FMC1 homolog isoform X3 [Penaeus monodon]